MKPKTIPHLNQIEFSAFATKKVYEMFCSGSGVALKKPGFNLLTSLTYLVNMYTKTNCNMCARRKKWG